MRATGRCRTLALATAVAMVSALIFRAPEGAVWAADDPSAAEAKKHYEEGTKAFNLGEYPRAIAEFKATYNAKPDPLLLYNIAQSYRLAGDAGQALFFYKSFLRNMPAAPNRKEVEGRIKTLEKQVAEQKKEPGSAAAAPVLVTPPVSPPSAAPQGLAAGPSQAPTTPPGSTTAAPPSAPTGLESATQPADAPPSAMPPASGSAPQVDLTTPATPAEVPSQPIYKKWWFWVGAAGAVLIVGGIAAANAKKGPNTTLGTFAPVWTPKP